MGRNHHLEAIPSKLVIPFTAMGPGIRQVHWLIDEAFAAAIKLDSAMPF